MVRSSQSQLHRLMFRRLSFDRSIVRPVSVRNCSRKSCPYCLARSAMRYPHPHTHTKEKQDNAKRNVTGQQARRLLRVPSSHGYMDRWELVNSLLAQSVIVCPCLRPSSRCIHIVKQQNGWIDVVGLPLFSI